MGEKLGNFFDLPMLLRLNSLDIRRVARNNLSLRTEEYFNLLSKFIEHAPKAMNTLNRIASLEADEYDIKNISDLKNMLDNIGCGKFLPIIDDIINAGKRGHNGFAADCAKKISDDFNKLFREVTAAKKTEKPQSIHETINENDPVHDNFTAAYVSYPLKKFLKQLDQEEATRKLRILAIDDAPVMLKTISSVLSDEYKVYGMTNPTMLEKFLHQITPELFLLDYQMPELNGFDLVPIIRSFDEHKDTPIIFLTSLGTTDHVSAALTLGACDFIVKPFQGNILREKIARHIVRKKLF